MSSRNPRASRQEQQQQQEGEPEAKRRRTSGRAHKPRNFLSVSHGSTRSYTSDKVEPEFAAQNDCFDGAGKLGRKVWEEKGPRGTKELDKFCCLLENWAFFPRWIGSAKEVKKLGKPGVHYAAGYPQLGQMIEQLGNDLSKWPCLPSLEARQRPPSTPMAPARMEAPEEASARSVPRTAGSCLDDTDSESSDDDTREMSVKEEDSSFPVDSQRPRMSTPRVRATRVEHGHRDRNNTPNPNVRGTTYREVTPSVARDEASVTHVTGNQEAQEPSVRASDVSAASITVDQRLKAIELEEQEIALKQKKIDAKVANFARFEELRERGIVPRKIRKHFPELAEFLSDDEEV